MITRTKTKNSSVAKYFAFQRVPSSSQMNKGKIILLAKEGKDKPNPNSKLANCFRNYINKSSGAYDANFDKLIRRMRPDWFVKKADLVKQKLIDIAKNGSKRPSASTKIGLRLSSYTTIKSGCFDKDFYKKLVSIRPDWFVFQSDLANQKKKEITNIAKNGMPKPVGTSLWTFFKNYRNRNPQSEFVSKIESLRPDWFLTPKELSYMKKDKIISMAKTGLPKPKSSTKLGVCFLSYIRKGSQSYDSKFAEIIRALRPDWYTTKQDLVKDKKRILLEMARSGQARPNQKDKKLGKLAGFLSRATSKNNCIYDSKFERLIRKTRPDWFINQSDRALIKKNQLLNLAKKGLPKPKQPEKIAISFSLYTNPKDSCYDKEFTKSIRKIRPDWFLTRSDIANKKKKQLISMAKSGCKKPKHSSLLGSSLYSYTTTNCSSYDENFDKLIKKLRPDWF